MTGFGSSLLRTARVISKDYRPMCCVDEHGASSDVCTRWEIPYGYPRCKKCPFAEWNQRGGR